MRAGSGSWKCTLVLCLVSLTGCLAAAPMGGDELAPGDEEQAAPARIGALEEPTGEHVLLAQGEHIVLADGEHVLLSELVSSGACDDEDDCLDLAAELAAEGTNLGALGAG